ncbi:MAG: hypothetical protein L0216_08355 [Planctomycetales bacterium]|nr:hypothetical protein [Planctomycetales bacterium]
MNGMPGTPDLELPRRSGLITAVAVLNVVIGLLCGCVGSLQGAVLLFVFDLPSWMGKLQEGYDRSRAEVQQEFDAKVAAAATDQEKASLESQRARLVPPALDFEPLGRIVSDPALKTYFAGDAAIGAFGNLLLLISGVGLLGRRHWGRTLAIATAFAKMLGMGALLLVGWAAVGRIVPEIEAFLEQVVAAAPAGQAPPIGLIGPQIKLWMAFQGGLGLAIASVWPAVQLLVLVPGGARAEFDEWAAWRARGGV